MSKLLVLTNTKGGVDSHRWYSKAINSVRNNLPKNSNHLIVECPNIKDHMESYWNSFDLAEYVCFVDDDDIIINNSLNVALDALDNNKDVAVVFTDEKHIDEDDNTILSPHIKNREVYYEDICASPQSVHHLVMIRCKDIDRNLKKVCEKFTTGYEWLIKGHTALNGGALHIPIDGYCWRQRHSSVSKSLDFKNGFGDNVHLIRCFLQSQRKLSGRIQSLVIK